MQEDQRHRKVLLSLEQRDLGSSGESLHVPLL